MSDSSNGATRPSRTDRGARARLYAAVGAGFWLVAAIVAYVRGAGIGSVAALAVLAFAIAVALAVSWFHESAGAVVMLASAVATVAYGVLRHWDITFWFMMLLAAIGPLLLAAYLFDAVRRQDTSEPPTR